jgi:DNA-3-methyladenine glycosylase I
VDYQAIFNELESTLIRMGNEDAGVDMRQRLDEFKTFATRSLTDLDYFRILIHVTFYSGFKAVTVESKLPVIDGYFRDYRTVADYGPRNISEMLNDDGMIRHKGKIQACIDNAQTFRTLVEKHGSFKSYVDSYSPIASVENLERLRRDLKERFRYLSKITSYHFLTDIGMPVLKPDRVVRRILYRLGLLNDDQRVDERMLAAAVAVGAAFVKSTGHPIRYVDIVFVAYGQVKSTGVGVSQGICLKDSPRCNVCGVTRYCRYPDKRI